MADTKISALTSLGAVPASGDYFPIVDVSDTTQAASGTTKKITASYFAFLGQAQSFTATQTVAPTSTSVDGLIVNMPSTTSGNAVTVNYNSGNRFFVVQKASTSQAILSDADLGSSLGPGLYIGRNSNGSTPASAFIRLTAKNGVDYYLWVGSNGKLQLSTSSPTNANDNSGTVVGTQS